MNKKIDYTLDALSGVKTTTLKHAHQAYSMLLENDERNFSENNKILDSLHRIQGELLTRKEWPVDDSAQKIEAEVLTDENID